MAISYHNEAVAIVLWVDKNQDFQIALQMLKLEWPINVRRYFDSRCAAKGIPLYYMLLNNCPRTKNSANIKSILYLMTILLHNYYLFKRHNFKRIFYLNMLCQYFSANITS